MFHSDQPIEKKEYDCLNRTEFSKQLAKAILSYAKKDNFAISLCGKWGSGKTSIINMVIEEINQLTNDDETIHRPIVVKFNPWNYSDCSQLIKQFFVTIQNELKTSDGSETLNAIGNALQKYSSVLDYSAYIPVIGPYLGPLKELVSGVGAHLAGVADENSSIDMQKQKVIEALSKQEQKIIVIIDDIDRLNNAQIRAIFQLVNSLAGFPNMIYLLSFDREVVTRALQEEQKCDGEEYLEKIIQVPFEVPEANKDLVNKVLFARLDDIFFSEEDSDIYFDSEYWGTVFSNCISPFIDSIRDVNRVVNAFEFKYGLMREEINATDLLALTTLQVCAPTVFSWIYHNSNTLTGSVESAGGVTGVEQKDNLNKYLELFNGVYPENPHCMMKVVQVLFPKFAWRTGGYIYSDESNNELRYKDRIASAERINRYFNLSLEEISISKKQIQSTITDYSKEQLVDYLSQLLKSDMLVSYLQELLARIHDIAPDRRKIFVDALIEMQTLNEAYDRKSVFLPIPAAKCYNAMIEILKRDNHESNTKLLKELLENVEAKNLAIISRIVEEIEDAFGRMGDYAKSWRQFVEESSLEEIEHTILEKIKLFSENENYFDYKMVEYIRNLWRYLDKESWDSYMKKILQQPANVPKYLGLCAGAWSAGEMSGWSFRNESFVEYIDKQEAYHKICSIKNTEEFSTLNYSVKEIAIAFYLWCSNEEDDYHNLNKEAVATLIPQWEVNEQ